MVAIPASKLDETVGAMPHLNSNGRVVLLFNACIIATFSAINDTRADEGGVSFWVPGLYGSLAATPQQPGWSLATIYYHAPVSAGDVNLTSTADLAFVIPTYVFATPVFGGQAAVSLMAVYGRDATSLASISDSVTGFGDLQPQFSLRWNAGVHNYMTYITADIPVGAYESTRLSNIGIGHGAVDVGAGYTYLNPQTGHEFSGVLGFTYNLTNPSTQYRNGVDMHFDWGSTIPDQAIASRPGRLRLQGDRLRQRGWRSGRLLPVASVGRRAAGRLHLSGRQHAGLS